MIRKLFRKIPTVTLFSALLLAICPTLEAQDADPFGEIAPPASRSDGSVSAPSYEPSVESASPRFDIDFQEANAAEACEYIQLKLTELDPKTPFNIVVSKEAENIILPSMRLRQITFEQFARFINSIGGGVQHLIADDPFAPGGGGDAVPPRGNRFGISDTDGIWYFWAEMAADSEKNPGASADIITRTFFIGEEAEATLSLIESALEASKAVSTRSQPTLKFHEASKSLIVVGHVLDLKLIEDVIAVLKQNQESKFMAERRAESQRYEMELEKLLQRMGQQERMAVEEMSQRKSQFEARIAQLETQLLDARSQFTETHPKIRELEEQLKAVLAEKESRP